MVAYAKYATLIFSVLLHSQFAGWEQAACFLTIVSLQNNRVNKDIFSHGGS